MSSLQAWAGLVHVRPVGGVSTALGREARGGYGTVLALASDAAGYRSLVEREMSSLSLAVVESDRVAPFATSEGDRELLELAAALSEHHPVQFRTFDTYTQDDA